MLLVLSFLIYFYIKDDTLRIKQQPNIVSWMNEAPMSQNSAIKKPPKTDNLAKLQHAEQPVQFTSPTAKKDRSYLTIYHDLQLATECSFFIQTNDEEPGGYDYLQNLTEAYHRQFNSSELLPVKQAEALELWIQQCVALKTAVFNRANINKNLPVDLYTDRIWAALNKELSQTQPETPAEQHLARTIKLGEQWTLLFGQLIDVMRGEYQHSESVREMMYAESYAINESINIMYQTNATDATEIQRLEQQAAALYETAEKRLAVDEAQRKLALEAFNPINAELESMLLSSYPDSFKKAMSLLHLNNEYLLTLGADSGNNLLYHNIKLLVPWHKSPSHIIRENAQIKDVDHYNLLIEPASILYLCYLGDDCDEGSSQVNKYCLGTGIFHNDLYPSACGKSLVDFFSEDYLTVNQWIDVSQLFDLMVEMYAP